MIVFDKVQHFYQEKTLAAFLMGIGLFDVEVGQIQSASWDVFSTEFYAQAFVLLAPSLLVQTYLFASFKRAKQLSCIRNLSVSEVIPLYSLYR